MVPNPTVYAQGLGSATGDGLNTFVQAATSVAQLRTVVGTGQMEVWLQGYVTFNDGGQGMFVWSSSATGPDDGGITTVVPNAATQGAWIRQPVSTVGDPRTIIYVIDGNGAVPTTGIKGQIPITFGFSINTVYLLADQSGSCVVDIWASTFANFNLPTAPTAANSICGTDFPTLSSANKLQDSTLTGWTKSFVAPTILVFNLQSATTITRLTIGLAVTRAT